MLEKKLVPKLRFAEFDGVWKVKQIANILTIGSGKDYKHLSSGNIPVYGTGGFMTAVNEFIFDGESVCIGRKGTIDKPMFLNEKFWTVDTLFYTHSFSGVTPKFVYSLFQNIIWYKYNEASGVPSLSKNTIGKIEVTIPQLPEQQKIASFLTEVDTKLSQLTKKKALLEDYKKGVMQQIFSQELRFKDGNGNDYGDWEEKKLGEVGRIVTGKTPSTTDKELWNGNIQFVTPTDINEDSKYQIETKRTVQNIGKLKLLPEKSIMYTCIASIGKMALSVQPCITNQQINSLIPNKEFDNEFIYYVLLKMTPKIKSSQTNTTLPIINKTEFSKFKISYPCLEEQTKIANFFSELDTKIEVLSTSIENTQYFKKGLLQQMFV
jgi:type I restriction enzyme S subunit